MAAVRKPDSKPEAKPETTAASKPETKLETRPTTKTESPSRTTVAAPAPVLHEPPEVQLATEARRILMLAATSKWPALRAHALEAAIKRPQLLEQFAPAALADDNRGVRFVACMSIAESRDTRFTDRITPLLADPSPSVQAAAMLALSRAGASVNFSPLASMVYDNDPEIRANAYLVLGELGNPSAIPLIRDSLGKGMKLVNPLRVSLVNLAAAEALVKLGDQNEVEPIRAALFAPPEQGELTIVACDSVRRLKDEVARAMLERIVSAGGSAQRSPEIRLAAVRALAALGATKGPAQVAIEYIKHPDARIRSQAAVLLGEIGTSEARAALGQLLADQDPTVQIAAAGGLDSVDTPTSALRQAQAD